MDTKYRRLTEHLFHLSERKWDATFSEIEEILGTPLPASARKHQAWWANQDRGQSSAWQSVGWRTAKLDLHGRRVTFYRNGAAENDTNAVSGGHKTQVVPLTFDQAKAGLAQHYGVDPSQIEITVKA